MGRTHGPAGGPAQGRAQGRDQEREQGREQGGPVAGGTVDGARWEVWPSVAALAAAAEEAGLPDADEVVTLLHRHRPAATRADRSDALSPGTSSSGTSSPGTSSPGTSSPGSPSGVGDAESTPAHGGVRARTDRAAGGSLVLTVATVWFSERGADVETGWLTLVVGDKQVLATESGQAHVLAHATDKLEHAAPVPDTGTRRVLAAVLLTLLASASDVEIALGEAVDRTERRVFGDGPGTGVVEDVYDLKREVAEARRALGPVSAAVPELVAEAEADRHRASSLAWLRRVESTTDRLAAHLQGHDDLLDAMLQVHLSQVSVRQNEDMRKISSWAAIAAVPTLVAGVYGMNFQHMPELDWTWGYPGAIAFMAASCGVLYRLFRRAGWL